MNVRNAKPQGVVSAALLIGLFLVTGADARESDWTTVVNNNDLIPPLYLRNFNSYNQPSVNTDGVVVIRARSRGGPPLGPATHGIYVRDMSPNGGPIMRILDRSTHVPGPNNLGSTFVETPSFPRIDMNSDTIATRGNHQPVHRYRLGDGSETRAGTTGIYSNPFGTLITGAAKLGDVPGFSYLRVPEFNGHVRFDVFPGSPAVTGGNTIVFKGNYTIAGIGKTGVYYRTLEQGETGGDSLPILIANNTDTLIPGTTAVFGSTAPPAAANGLAVFAGFDNEWAPNLGGIYAARLEYQPRLVTLVGIGDAVPQIDGEATFNDFGEALAFDGRFVAFWGAWGGASIPVRLYCPTEGNKDRIAFCNQKLVCRDTGEVRGDPSSICDDTSDPYHGQRCYTERSVPAEQGIFVHDLKKGVTHLLARKDGQFDDFLFWNYAGKTPCSGKGHAPEGDEEDGESVRWRSSAYLAVSGTSGTAVRVAFKAKSAATGGGTGDSPVVGIYLAKKPGRVPLVTILDTTMAGTLLDPQAPPDSTILELGLEREGLRGKWLAISAKMGFEGAEHGEDGMAGVYVTRIPGAGRN